MFIKSLLVSLALTSSVYAYDFKAVAEQHILPGYQKLTETTQTLAKTADAYCTEKKSIEKIRDAYVDAFNSWQSVQHIRFGPVQYLTREHRYQMWPDKRGTVAKHLNRLLVDPDLILDDFDISNKSVAVQGFSALERLLFTDKAIDDVHCKVITAISLNLSQMSANLLTDWSQGDSAYVEFFVTPGGGNEIFESDNELASTLLNSLYTQLEFITTQKLDRPLGAEIKKARGKRAEGWRSQTSLTALQQNLQATYQLYQLAYAPSLDNTLAEKIESAYSRANKALLTINMPLKQAVSDEVQRKNVIELRQAVSDLKKLIGRDLAAQLQLSLGFNSLDGD